jgi:hypothetical protein
MLHLPYLGAYADILSDSTETTRVLPFRNIAEPT